MLTLLSESHVFIVFIARIEHRIYSVDIPSWTFLSYRSTWPSIAIDSSMIVRLAPRRASKVPEFEFPLPSDTDTDADGRWPTAG